MSNVIEITIKGNDQSSAPLKRAGENMQSLAKNSKSLGQTMNEVSQVASALGNKHMVALSQQTGNVIAAASALSGVFRGLTWRAGLVGVAVAGIGYAISKFVESKEIEETTKALKDMGAELDVELQRSKALQKEGNQYLNQLYAQVKAEDFRHLKRLEQLKEFLDKDAEVSEVRKAKEIEDALHKQNLENINLTDYEKHLNSMEELDRNYNQVKVEEYIKGLDDVNGAILRHYTEGRQFLDTYRQFWFEAHRGMFSYAAEGVKVVSGSLSDAVVEVAMNTKSASEAFADLGKSIARMFAQWIINRAIAWLAEKVLSAIGLSLAKAQAGAVSIIAAGVAAAWAPAATASLIATYGQSATAASALIPLMSLNAAAAQGLAIGAGQAHAGASYIPEEATYLLSKGERVIPPQQNADLTDFLSGGGSRSTIIQIDGRKLGDTLYAMSRDGRLRIDGRAVV